MDVKQSSVRGVSLAGNFRLVRFSNQKGIDETMKPAAAARLLSAAIVILICGCATKNYKRPITGFQTASAQVIVASKNYYELANKVERDHLIDDRAATGDPIDPRELKAVSERFSAEDIAARIDALGVLADYGSLLLQLATSDAPQQINTQVDALSASVGALSDRVARLCTNCSERE